MDSDNIVNTPNSRKSKQSKSIASPDQQTNQNNNRCMRNNKRIQNKGFHNNLFCCGTANTSMFSSIASPGVRCLTIFSDDLMNNNSCSTKVGNLGNNNFGEMVNNISNQMDSVNLTSMGGTDNGNTTMDFIMPKLHDSSFVASMAYGWRLKNIANNLMMHSGQCMCYNHQQNFMHNQIQNHPNNGGLNFL